MKEVQKFKRLKRKMAPATPFAMMGQGWLEDRVVSRLTVGFFPVSNSVNDDGFGAIINVEEDPVVTHAQAVALSGSQFLNIVPAGVISQRIHALKNFISLIRRDRFEVFFDVIGVVKKSVNQMRRFFLRRLISSSCATNVLAEALAFLMARASSKSSSISRSLVYSLSGRRTALGWPMELVRISV